MHRVRVLTQSIQGNPKEIVTVCKTAEEAARRETMYKERYADADIFVEEISNDDEPFKMPDEKLEKRASKK